MSTVVPAPSVGVPTPAPYYAPESPVHADSATSGIAVAHARAATHVSRPWRLAAQYTVTGSGGHATDAQAGPGSTRVRPTNSPAASQPPMSGLPWNHAHASQYGDRHRARGRSRAVPGTAALESERNRDRTPCRVQRPPRPFPPKKNSVPQLLNPRDQVASLRTGQSWGYSTITWPTHRRAPTDRVPPVEQQRDLREWDESGWQSVGKGVQ